jgi:hypothetical protein
MIEATQQNYTGVLIRLHQDRQALSQLKTIETHLSSRAALQLATLSKDRVRRLWLRSAATFQDMVFTFVQQSTLADAPAFAAIARCHSRLRPAICTRWMTNTVL